ncbi:Rieske (2Fe-2S) protein [Nisaea sediminum]|uniref:Rieske (2Fe-2S) protein n=1 Tax=Nisaea sediminum TaxID=2775867 RepID=UPI0018661108|nr:Rieske (2Fe-2S) protein [Nisaea sediminum]
MNGHVEPHWVEALPLEDLKAAGSKIFKAGGKQIALFHADGAVHACNNRCPHEGYPLIEGTLDQADGACRLTCNWHNWKFDLANGANQVGGDRLRIYPVQIRDGSVFVDIADPPAEERIERALANLHESFRDHNYTRMTREIARLKSAGGDPLDAVRQAVLWTHDRFEWGTTHAIAAAPDWLELGEGYGGRDAASALIPFVEVVAHLAWDSLRWEPFPFSEGVAAFDPDRLVDAIESEDEAAALALVRGAIAGPGWKALDAPLTRAALAHYQDFGHSLIYCYKTRQLVERLGEDLAEPLYLALARSLVNASREDLIPEFRAYGPSRAAWDDAGGDPVSAEEFYALNVPRALERANRSSGDRAALFDALFEAAAWQMLHFDTEWGTRHDRPVPDNINWLDFTHGITFANAVRAQCSRHGDLWPDALLQMACFTGRNAAYVDAQQDSEQWNVGDTEAFFEDLLPGLFDHAEPEYIVSAHMVKLPVAAREEIRLRPDAPWAPVLAAAVNRFFHSRIKRKHVMRTAKQSLAFVAAEG